MLWLWLIALIRIRQGLEHFPIGHTCMHYTPSRGIRNSLGSIQRNRDDTKHTYVVHVIIPWEPVLDESVMILDPGVGPISSSNVMKNHLYMEEVIITVLIYGSSHSVSQESFMMCGSSSLVKSKLLFHNEY